MNERIWNPGLWTAFCARLFESYGFSWHYWEFCSGFGIYNPKTRRFRQKLVNALLSNDTSWLKLGEPENGSGPELLQNGDFSADQAYWNFGAWRTPAQATATVLDGEFVVNVQRTGEEPWHIQLIQDGLTSRKDAPIFSASRRESDRNRTISFSIDGDAQTNFTSFGGNTIVLSPEMKTYTLFVHINNTLATDEWPSVLPEIPVWFILITSALESQ